jgi:hypothetical protein
LLYGACGERIRRDETIDAKTDQFARKCGGSFDLRVAGATGGGCTGASGLALVVLRLTSS